MFILDGHKLVIVAVYDGFILVPCLGGEVNNQRTQPKLFTYELPFIVLELYVAKDIVTLSSYPKSISIGNSTCEVFF
jgi:hypothetical protein